jgi:RNase adaptor protein for sRNA GlmZ degradation
MLKVKIFSFSYRKSGIPVDETSNGGGFVFDCRFIYNPGREAKFIPLNGKDEEVVEFMDKDEKMQKFLENVYSIIDLAVDNYISRDFNNLMVSFGCTGGQHRSVYSAEKLRGHLQKKYGEAVTVSINHSEIPELSTE